MAGELLQEMLPDQFMSYSEEELCTLVAEAVKERFSASGENEDSEIEEYLKRELQREKEFMRVVLEAYERWSQDGNNVVLWDVDDTMGRVDPVNGEWRFRPAMRLLIPYLSMRYPSIKNGILTTRSVENAMDGFDRYPDLLGFFDTSNIYSARDLGLWRDQGKSLSEQEEEEKALEELLRSMTDMDVSPAVINKYIVMRELSKSPGINYRIVDDCAIADIAGKSGVCVYHMQPNI